MARRCKIRLGLLCVGVRTYPTCMGAASYQTIGFCHRSLARLHFLHGFTSCTASLPVRLHFLCSEVKKSELMILSDPVCMFL